MSAVLLALAACAAIDGDTLRCGPERIRLLRIDAPESGQPGAREAADALRLLVEGNRVTCVVRGRDAYGRLLGECFAGEGTSLSDRLLRQGAARPYRRGRR